MEKILFVDRDGTLVKPLTGGNFILYPRDQQPIAGAQEAIARYAKTHIIYGISNQAGIAAGHKCVDSVLSEMQYTLNLFPQIQSMLFCPDFEGFECWEATRGGGSRIFFLDETREVCEDLPPFRKPSHGMVQLVFYREIAVNLRHISYEDCLFVGDRPEDAECAQNAGINFMWAKDWREGG
ncbi:HAD hydrolase-like protein [Roseofilum sp. Belize Diploria]|uniref:HAD hydrolase-like protein n=1 Tax=Roseofilum sp. Belize Diploria TaxID=2821501 RepID=UPI001AFEA822|nr:HAD hydrolase-like protein [Roseofilum sp. Belize Diploria]MBP0008062.1 HAD hydrolase-like protein [Roseofilum sp. Belize Diploria]